MAKDPSSSSSSSSMPLPDSSTLPVPIPPPEDPAPPAPAAHTFTSLQEIKDHINQLADTHDLSRNPNGTGRDFIFLPFDRGECGDELQRDIQTMAENIPVRQLALDLYETGAAENEGTHPQGVDWDDDTLIEQFNRCPAAMQQQLLIQAALKRPTLIQFGEPKPWDVAPAPRAAAPSSPLPSSSSSSSSSSSLATDPPAPAPAHRPGPGDTIFIAGHGSFDHSAVVSSKRMAVSPKNLIDRMRDSGIPESIGKINLQSCGGSGELFKSLRDITLKEGLYNRSQIIAYGPNEKSYLLKNEKPLSHLDKGMHLITLKRDQEQLDHVNEKLKGNIDAKIKAQETLKNLSEHKRPARRNLESVIQENDQEIAKLNQEKNTLIKSGGDPGNKTRHPRAGLHRLGSTGQAMAETAGSGPPTPSPPRLAPEAEPTPQLGADTASSSSSSSLSTASSSSSAEPKADAEGKEKRKSVKDDIAWKPAKPSAHQPTLRTKK